MGLASSKLGLVGTTAQRSGYHPVLAIPLIRILTAIATSGLSCVDLYPLVTEAVRLRNQAVLVFGRPVSHTLARICAPFSSVLALDHFELVAVPFARGHRAFRYH